MMTTAHSLSGALTVHSATLPLARANHFAIDSQQFGNDFDQRAFYLRHDLSNHPLLQLPAMAELSQRLRPHLVDWNIGNAKPYSKTEELTRPGIPCRETILGIAERSGWVLLRSIEQDPLYATLVNELLDEIRIYSEKVRPGMQQRRTFLFISSRAAVTPYHFDPEHNLLLQMRGEKTLHLWDPTNRDVLTEEAIDNYYAGVGSNRDLPYRDDFLDSAYVLPLKAGQGVHIPLHAPHWVRTESQLSISMAITFRSHHSKYEESVRVGNGHARRLGILPPTPRTSIAWDATARAIYVGDRVLRRTRNLINKAHRMISPDTPEIDVQYE